MLAISFLSLYPCCVLIHYLELLYTMYTFYPYILYIMYPFTLHPCILVLRIP